MIRVEPSSDCFTLFFKNRPVLKVSTQHPLIEVDTDNSARSQSDQEKELERENHDRNNRPSFELID